ncbi:LOW QUALITY PROTEIN: golgin subfamily A member 4-like [Mercenaria mercenaria]|uniref:LOW QUALITY PROTEIN: golgin subfamily A member 4-like n=1 Tax=Mercenaria mercenaria TaxID=6596 RepID=UPI00234F3FFB|nr:LOW QUALITY PROTEIN: golgin subfamily A member 4-like [Mercenaria mercenaria]
MACGKGGKGADGLKKIDSLLDALVKYIKKQPTTAGINKLSSKVKKEIQREIVRAEERKVVVRQLQEDKVKYKEQIENYTKVHMKERHDMEEALKDVTYDIELIKPITYALHQCITGYGQLRQYIEDQIIKDADRMNNLQENIDETITLQKMNIQHLERELESRDLNMKRLKENLMTTQQHYDSKMIEISYRNKVLNDSVKEKDSQLSELSKNLHQMKATLQHLEREIEGRGMKIKALEDINLSLKTLHETETKYSGIVNSLQRKNQSLERDLENSDRNVKNLQEELHCLKTEIYGKKGLLVTEVRETNKRLSEQKDTIVHLENKLKDKDIQLLKTSEQLKLTWNRLQTTKTECGGIITSLKKKNQCIEVDIENRDLKIKDLQKRLDSIRKEMTSENEILRKKMKTQEKQLSKQRDELQQASNQLYDNETDESITINTLKQERQEKENHISELSEQLKQAVKTVDDKDAEVRQIDISLKEKLRYIQAEGERVRHLEELLNRKMVEISQINDKNFLSKKVKEKESQLHKQRDQLDRNLERLRETEPESDEIKTSLERKIQNLVTDIERRDLHVKDLEEKLDSLRTELSGENERLEQKLIAKDKQLSVLNGDLEETMIQANKTAKEKDHQISKLREQQQYTLKTLQNRETESNEIIKSLERKVELRNQKIKQHKETLKSTYFTMTQISDRNKFLEIRIKEKDEHSDQRDSTLERLHKRETELLGNVTALKKKNLDLESYIENSDLKVKDLENRFNSMRTELKGENELLIKKLEEKDMDHGEHLQQANNLLIKREIELNDIITSLKKQNQEEEYRKSELEDQLKQTLKKLDDKEVDMTEIDTSLNRKLKFLEAEVDSRERNVRHLEELLNDRKIEVTKVTESNERLEKMLKEMDDRLREQNKQLRKKTQHLQSEVEHRDRKVNDLEKMLHSKEVENRENEQEKGLRGKDEKTSELKELLEQTSRKLHDTEIELDETKTRLSKAMGDRLTDNNPNITDLSDRNRPTKLAERCAELYDNQWTDAFDILNKCFDTEENVIEALLWILQDVMTFCETKAHRQMEELGRELIFADKHESGDILADVRKLFKDCRKTVAPVAVGNLYKVYMFHLRKSTDETLRTALEVSSYTSECLEICWFMVIQDPPVAFAPLLRKGSSFNTDLYKPYTSSGTHIEYVVWPALLLHEGGPILAKGVAQGHGKKSKKSTFLIWSKHLLLYDWMTMAYIQDEDGLEMLGTSVSVAALLTYLKKHPTKCFRDSHVDVLSSKVREEILKDKSHVRHLEDENESMHKYLEQMDNDRECYLAENHDLIEELEKCRGFKEIALNHVMLYKKWKEDFEQETISQMKTTKEIMTSQERKIQSLLERIEIDDQKIKHLEREKIKIRDKNEQTILKIKEDQRKLHEMRFLLELKEMQKERENMHHSLTKAHEEEKKMDEICSSLKNQVLHLEQELGHRNQRVKQLENSLETNKQLAARLKTEKDDQISDLRDRLQQTLKTLHDKDVEMRDPDTSLKKKIKQQIECRDRNDRHQEEILSNEKTEYAQMCDRIIFLENKVKEKDEHLRTQDDQLKMQNEKEMGLDCIITSLKKINRSHETDLQRRNLQIKDLKEQIDSLMIEINSENKRCTQKLQEKDKQLSDLKNQLQQSLNRNFEKETEQNRIINSIKNENQCLVEQFESSGLKEHNLQTILHCRKHEISDMNKQLTNKVAHEKDDQLIKMSYQLKNTLKVKDAEWNGMVSSLNTKLENLESEMEHLKQNVRRLEEMLNSTKIKLRHANDRNEFLEAEMKGKDGQLSERSDQLDRTLKMLQDTETELNGIIMTPKNNKLDLETKVEHSDMKVKDLEKQMNTMKTEITSETELLTKKAEEKYSKLSDQLTQGRNQLQDKEAELGGIITSLQKKNEYLEAEIKRLNLELTSAEKTVNSKSVEIRNECERIAARRTKEKDTQITDLKDELQQTLKRFECKESEKETIDTSLKKKVKNLESEVEQQKRHNRHLEDVVNSKEVEISRLRDRNELLENILQEKDNQLSDQDDKLNHNLKRLQEKDTELEGIFSALKERNQGLETDIERRDLKVKDLEENLHSMKVEISSERDSHEREMMEKCKQMAILREQLQQALNQVKEKETESSDINNLLKKQSMEKDAQISHLKDQQQETLKMMEEKEAQFGEIHISLKKKLNELEGEVKHRDQKIRHQTDMLNSKKDEMRHIIDTNASLESNMTEKDNKLLEQSDQLNRTSKKLRETEAELGGIISSLKKKSIDLETAVKQRDLKINVLKEQLENLKSEQIGRNELLLKELKDKDKQLSEQVNQLQQALDQLCKKEAKLNGVITSLNKQNKEKDNQISELTDQKQHILKQLNDKKAEQERIDTFWEKKFKSLETEAEFREQNLKHLEEILNSKRIEIAEINNQNDLLENTVKEKDHQLREQREQLQQKSRQLQREVEHRDSEILHSQSNEKRESGYRRDVRDKEKVVELNNQLQMTLKKLQDTEIELDETKTRLSKAMGDRLTDNNPNITDLSDRNRPTKLAERCAELYDNQWTDAFDILDKYFDTEEHVIGALLQIMQDSMTFCVTKAREQMEKLGRELKFADQYGNGDVSADVRKLFKDCRRAVASVAVGNLYTMYVSHLRRSADKTLRTALEVSPYTSECLEICWFMVIQDPPVAFAPLLRKGSGFNTDLYKPYTSSGTLVDYVVWPPLLLHEGGPILAKGVAQGCGKKSERST